MKRIGMLILSMLLYTVLSAGDDLVLKFNNLKEIPNVTHSYSDSSTFLPDPIERPKGCFLFALDTAVMPGIQLGVGRIKYDSTYVSENMLTLHLNTIGFVTTMGISWSVNRFRSLDRTGFYTSYNLGLDYVLIIAPNPGGGAGENDGVFPNITYGFGYSFKIGTNSFFRISLDFGLKLIISNLKISFIF